MHTPATSLSSTWPRALRMVMWYSCKSINSFYLWQIYASIELMFYWCNWLQETNPWTLDRELNPRNFSLRLRFLVLPFLVVPLLLNSYPQTYKVQNHVFCTSNRLLKRNDNTQTAILLQFQNQIAVGLESKTGQASTNSVHEGNEEELNQVSAKNFRLRNLKPGTVPHNKWFSAYYKSKVIN